MDSIQAALSPAIIWRQLLVAPRLLVVVVVLLLTLILPAPPQAPPLLFAAGYHADKRTIAAASTTGHSKIIQASNNNGPSRHQQQQQPRATTTTRTAIINSHDELLQASGSGGGNDDSDDGGTMAAAIISRDGDSGPKRTEAQQLYCNQCLADCRDASGLQQQQEAEEREAGGRTGRRQCSAAADSCRDDQRQRQWRQGPKFSASGIRVARLPDEAGPVSAVATLECKCRAVFDSRRRSIRCKNMSTAEARSYDDDRSNGSSSPFNGTDKPRRGPQLETRAVASSEARQFAAQ